MDAISERRRKLSGKQGFKTTSAVVDVWIEALNQEYTVLGSAQGQTGKKRVPFWDTLFCGRCRDRTYDPLLVRQVL